MLSGHRTILTRRRRHSEVACDREIGFPTERAEGVGGLTFTSSAFDRAGLHLNALSGEHR